MNRQTQIFQEGYAAALESHLGGLGETGLHDAYQFGRKALADGLSLLDITMLHQEVLGVMAARWPAEEQAARIQRAAEFFAEALAPFEMALRGWHDTAASLRLENDELEARVADRTAAHREAVERLDRAQQLAGSGSWEWNPQTGEQIWSKQLYRICGLPQGPHPAGAYNIFDFICDSDRERHGEWLALLLAGKDPGPIEYQIRTPDGRHRDVQAEGEAVAGEPAGRMSFTLQDITERKAAEAQLQDLQAELAHASRLSAMGQMAAAIVHEVNQPLAAIGNYMATARRLLDRGDDPARAALRTALERAGEQAVRGAHIIDRLRGFASQAEKAPRPEMIAPLLKEAVELLMVGTRTDGVRIAMPSTLPAIAVLVDKIQVQQVLLNLLRNAVEAVAGRPRREIALSVAVQDDFVQISVADSGSGLADEVKARLFQPFVSTKKSGMGIGLSICHRIITAHDGRLWAEPGPMGGTIFHLTLPVASQVPASEAAGTRQ